MDLKKPIILLFILLLSFPVFCNIGEQETKLEPYKKWSVNLGPGTQTAWNWAGISRNFFLNNNLAVFLTAGAGTIFVGGGVAWYHNFVGSGPVVSGTIGIIGGHANVGYQIKYDKSTYFLMGAGYGSYFMQHNGFLPYASYEYRF